MNDLTTRNVLTPPLSKSLGSHELDKHRAMVGLELEVLSKKVDRFGWDRDRGSASHDRIVRDWMDVLQDYPLDEVQAACRAALLSNPNKMPNEGHVRAEILRARAKIVAALPEHEPVEVREPRVTPEQAAQIIADAGIRVKRIEAAE